MKLEGGRVTRELSLAKQLVFTVIITVSALFLGEVCIRIWANYVRTSYERYNPSTGRLELVPNVRSAKGGHELRINSRGFLGPEFTEEPAPGVYRIMAVGDSCTFSGGVWELAYPGILERYLNAGAGRRRFEVINAGIEGYNSTFARERIREELLRYHPDMMLIYVGWNDLMKVDPRNAGAVGRDSMIAGWMEQSYLIRAYRKVLFYYLRPLLFAPRVVVDGAEAQAYEGFVPALYEENLRVIIKTLRASHVESMLMTLPTVVRLGMTREEIAKENVFFPYFAGSYSVGEFSSLHQSYNRAIREVGHTLEVPIVDLDRTFKEQRERRRLFWDTMHPSREGQCLIARELYEAIGQKFGLPKDIPGEAQGGCR